MSVTFDAYTTLLRGEKNDEEGINGEFLSKFRLYKQIYDACICIEGALIEFNYEKDVKHRLFRRLDEIKYSYDPNQVLSLGIDISEHSNILSTRSELISAISNKIFLSIPDDKLVFRLGKEQVIGLTIENVKEAVKKVEKKRVFFKNIECDGKNKIESKKRKPLYFSELKSDPNKITAEQLTSSFEDGLIYLSNERLSLKWRGWKKEVEDKEKLDEMLKNEKKIKLKECQFFIKEFEAAIQFIEDKVIGNEIAKKDAVQAFKDRYISQTPRLMSCERISREIFHDLTDKEINFDIDLSDYTRLSEEIDNGSWKEGEERELTIWTVRPDEIEDLANDNDIILDSKDFFDAMQFYFDQLHSIS